MTESDTNSTAYCSQLLKARDEDRWLASAYASDAETRLLRALYAVQCELRRIPSAVSEPPLGEIRLQWWREAFAELRNGNHPRAHPVVEEAKATGLADEKYAARLEAAIDANARPLYGEGFTDIDDLTSWFEKADGAFDGLAILALGGDEPLAQQAANSGALFAMAREGAQLAPQLKTEMSDYLLNNWPDHAARLKETPPSLAPGLAHLSLTQAYLNRGARPFPIMKRLRLFRCIAFSSF